MIENIPQTALHEHLAKAREVLAETRAFITDAFQKDFAYRRKPDQTFVTALISP